MWRQVADTHGGVKQLQQRALAGDAEMLAAALRRRSFDELSMLSVTAAVAAFWYNEARPSAEWRSAQRAAACAYGPSAELVVPSVAAELARCGIVELRGALSPAQLAAARRDVARIVAERDRFEEPGNATDVRQDAITWLEPLACCDQAGGGDDDEAGHGLNHCVRLLRGVAHALQTSNKAAGVGGGRLHVVPLQCQLAGFRGDRLAGYRAHRDR